VTVYVASYHSNTVTPIDTATNTVLPAIKVGIAPYVLAITP
jgi:YVTN family beta-propeller protein